MRSLLEQIDIFGKSVGFKHKDQPTYKNIFGGILTIFYVSISVSIYSYYLSIYIERKESRVTYQALQLEQPPLLNLTELNYSINVYPYLLNDRGYIIEISIEELFEIFDIKAFYYNDFRLTEITFGKCSGSNYLNMTQVVNYMNLCLAPAFGNRNDTIISENKESQIVFSFKNKTKFQVDFYGYSLAIVLITKDVFINLDNYKNPLNRINRLYTKIIYYENLINSFHYTELTYGITQITTDYSWFFESNINKVENMNLFNIIQDQTFAVYDDIFYRIILHSGFDGHTYKKTFQKLPEFLASASSLSSSLFFFFKLAINIFKNITLDIEIMNDIFQYDSIPIKLPPIELNKAKEKIQINDNISTLSRNSKAFFNKRIYNLKTIQKPPMNHNIEQTTKFDQCKMIFLLCNFCRKNKSKLYSDYLLGISILNYYLDSNNYVLKMMEIEFLKYLLLSKDQLKLFKFVKLDYLSDQSNHEFISILQNLKDNSFLSKYYKRNIETNIKENPSFQRIITKTDHSNVDKKILKSVGYFDVKL